MTVSVSSGQVLIVDDEKPIRQTLARWIEALGYRTAEADSAEAALDSMTASPSAVVFCDVQMPGHGGLWLTSTLRARFPEAAIILATGVTTVPPATSMRSGVLAYITKPFDQRAVRDALETAMGWHDATVASGPQPEDAAERIQAWLDGLDDGAPRPPSEERGRLN